MDFARYSIYPIPTGSCILIICSLLPKPKNEFKRIEYELTEPSSDPATAAPPTIATETEEARGLTTVSIPTTRASRELSLVQKSIPLETNADGSKNYELLAHVGHGKDRQIQTHLADTKPKASLISPSDLVRPSAEEVARETEEAKRALNRLVLERNAKTQPKSFTATSATDSFQIIRYMDREGMGERIVKMVEMPRDPLEPPKFSHKRMPRAPPSPPAPRLHSPPRRLREEEVRAWHIPPSISSWKNPKGYTVPLDKRLAADGKGLQEKTINPRVADMAEALYLAEKHNKEEVEMRAAIERKVAEQEKRQKEEQLRKIAETARAEAKRLEEELSMAAREEERRSRRGYRDRRESRERSISPSRTAYLSIRERERIKRERAYEREREMRLARMNPEYRKRILERESERDISERIALGQANPTIASASSSALVTGTNEMGEAIFDERLFGRTQGINSGFYGGDDEVYNLYDRPLMASASHLIYRPSFRSGEGDAGNAIGDDDDEGAAANEKPRGKTDRGFHGANYIEAKEGPVQFERSSALSITSAALKPGLSTAVVDPFGLDQFISDAKKGKNPR